MSQGLKALLMMSAATLPLAAAPAGAETSRDARAAMEEGW